MAGRAGKRTVKAMDSAVNITLLVAVIIACAFAGYALWDSRQVLRIADKSQFTVFKPTVEDEGMSFEELRAINPETFAWLTVYGTNIDYPVVQSLESNIKYVNTDIEGNFSVSGTIFLDKRNANDFTDFNSIIYGHHMDKQMMFGEIGEFWKEEKFDAHRYANLFFDGKDHGVEFFTFIHADSYDNLVYTPDIAEENRQEYLDYIYSLAIYTRDTEVTVNDRIVLLSTCSAFTTNGRDILIGKIYDEPFEDTFAKLPHDWTQQFFTDGRIGFLSDFINQLNLPEWLYLQIMLTSLLLIVLICTCNRRKYLKKVELVKQTLNSSLQERDEEIYEQEINN
jgi:sortase B